MRNEIVGLEQNSRKEKIHYFEIRKLSFLADSFLNKCMMKQDSMKNLINLLEARSYLEESLTLIKSMIEPAENPLIGQIELETEVSQKLETYFDNLLSILDAETKEIRRKVEDINVGISSITITTKLLRERLIDYYNNLIIFPLQKAFYVCAEKDLTKIENSHFNGKIITKNDLFEYILFREIVISAKLKGASTRQKVSMANASSGATFQDTNIVKNSPRRMSAFSSSGNIAPPSIDSLDFSQFEEPDVMKSISEGGEEDDEDVEEFI